MKQLKIGDWYYRMMGYGGSDSQMCCIRRKTDEQTPAGMLSLFNGTGKIQPIPVSDIYEAVDECGRVFKVSANDLAANGHIGIGTLKEPGSNGHVAWLYREDARLLVKMGKYTAEEITAVFPMALTEYGDEEYEKYIEEHSKEFTPMTDKQEEILRAAFAANCEKEKREKEEEARKFAAEVAELRKKYNYIPCPKDGDKWLTVGEKRRNILAVLKHEFPGVKFSARTRNGSTSDSIRVEYEDGPALGKVNAVMRNFETSDYNANEDIWESVTYPASVVCGGFDYVFVTRKTTVDLYEYVINWMKSNVRNATDEYARSTATRIIDKMDLPDGGYDVLGLELDEKGEWSLAIKAKAEQKKQSAAPVVAADGNGVTITENTEKNGIEIRFPSMPSEAIRNYMKAKGWRWTRYNGGLWYNRATDGNRKMAADIAAMWEKENGKAAA